MLDPFDYDGCGKPQPSPLRVTVVGRFLFTKLSTSYGDYQLFQEQKNEG